MEARQYEIWIADLNPGIGTEAGKIRPVVVVQTDLLNKHHPSTLVCPITTNVQSATEILRVHITRSVGLEQDSDIMMDQVRAIDNKRLVRKVGKLSSENIEKIKFSLSVIFDL